MSVKVGVWIDHMKAILVVVTGSSKTVKKIASGIEKPVRTRSSHTYSPNDFVAEDRLERKFNSQLKTFFDEVIDNLGGAEAVLILGPGEAKGELHKRLNSKKIRGLSVEVEAADKMTDRQLAAAIVKHFAAVPEKATTAPKKAAPRKKPTKPSAAKPQKKSGK